MLLLVNIYFNVN